MPRESATRVGAVAAILILTGSLFVSAALLSPAAHDGNARVVWQSSLSPSGQSNGANAPASAGSRFTSPDTGDRGPFTVTFTVPNNKPAAGAEITFRACYHGTCCDVYVIDGEFAGVGNCFTFTPLGNDLPAHGSAHAVPSGGTTGNLSVNATNTSATFTLGNGTLWYSVSGPKGYEVVSAGSGTALPAAGNLSVNGTNLSETFTLAKGPTYVVQYRETDLIAGTSWCTLFSNCSSGKSASIKDLSPGTYLYSIAPVPGYTANVTVSGGSAGRATFGTFTITRKSVDITIRFQPVLYEVTLNESGLAAGATWHLKATCTSEKTNVTGCDGMKASGSDTATTTGGNITLMLRNGTYTWTITKIKGYTLELDGVADPTWSGTYPVAGQYHGYIGKVTLIK